MRPGIFTGLVLLISGFYMLIKSEILTDALQKSDHAFLSALFKNSTTQSLSPKIFKIFIMLIGILFITAGFLTILGLIKVGG